MYPRIFDLNTRTKSYSWRTPNKLNQPNCFFSVGDKNVGFAIQILRGRRSGVRSDCAAGRRHCVVEYNQCQDLCGGIPVTRAPLPLPAVWYIGDILLWDDRETRRVWPYSRVLRGVYHQLQGYSASNMLTNIYSSQTIDVMFNFGQI